MVTNIYTNDSQRDLNELSNKIIDRLKKLKKIKLIGFQDNDTMSRYFESLLFTVFPQIFVKP